MSMGLGLVVSACLWEQTSLGDHTRVFPRAAGVSITIIAAGRILQVVQYRKPDLNNTANSLRICDIPLQSRRYGKLSISLTGAGMMDTFQDPVTLW